MTDETNTVPEGEATPAEGSENTTDTSVEASTPSTGGETSVEEGDNA